MKTQFKFRLLAVLVLAGTVAVAGTQSDPEEEVPGDNFSLEGALELFKKSASPQEFEQLLNSPDSKVNNLDLNGDGDIDYIRVVDRADDNIHTFTLQALVANTEAQDIAVIELEKRADGTAVLQIIGDADIYGIETIIEPTQEVRVNAGASTARTVVNVWAWPSVQYVYGPYYSGWVSPWYWSYYPGWWRPWRPFGWSAYYSYWTPYRPYYSFCYSHRVVYASRLYRPYRSTSVIVYNRHNTQIQHYRSTRSDSYTSRGYYRNDRSGNNSRYDRSGNNSRSRSDNNTYNGRRSSDNSSISRSGGRDRSTNYAPPASDMTRESASRRTRQFSPGTNNDDVKLNRPNNLNRSNDRSSGNENPTRQFQSRQRQESSPQQSNRRSDISAPSSGHQRSFSTPSDGGGRQRSVSPPSGGGSGGGHQRSFSPPSGGGGGGGRSHGTPSGGGGGGGSSGGRRTRN